MFEYLMVALFLALISKVLWHKKFPWWLRVVSLGAFALYLVFFTMVGGYIRPFFTNMDSWSIEKGGISYHYRGTGVFINNHDVLTNEHVVSGCPVLAVMTSYGMYVGEVVATSERNSIFSGKEEVGDDIAIIRTDADTPHFTFLRRKGVKVGDEIISPEYTSDVGVFEGRRGTLTDVGHYVKHTGLG